MQVKNVVGRFGWFQLLLVHWQFTAVICIVSDDLDASSTMNREFCSF